MRPLYETDNPGARTPAVVAELNAMGARKFHASAVPGADPRAVERELLLAFDRMKHGAELRVWPKPSIFGRIADHFRVARYNLFRARKAAKEIEAKLSPPSGAAPVEGDGHG